MCVNGHGKCKSTRGTGPMLRRSPHRGPVTVCVFWELIVDSGKLTVKEALTRFDFF